MMLQALIAYAERENLGDPDFESVGVRWLIPLDVNGKLAGGPIPLVQNTDERKPRAKQFARAFTSPNELNQGTKSHFLCDTLERATLLLDAKAANKTPARRLQHDYLGERVFHLNREVIQTLMYLKLSVAGHLTVFVTRTRGPFWSARPAPVLLAAVVGTQLTATVIAVFGWFMPAIGWRWALAVWGYALAWLFVNDRIKLTAYRIFDPEQPVLSTCR